MDSSDNAAPERDRWRHVPMIGWIRSYERGWLRGDLIAGVAVAALIVPKNLGYASIAGVPVRRTLCRRRRCDSLRRVRNEPSDLDWTEFRTGGGGGHAVLAAKICGDSEAWRPLYTITLASGVLFLLLAVFKMGWLAQFLYAPWSLDSSLEQPSTW